MRAIILVGVMLAALLAGCDDEVPPPTETPTRGTLTSESLPPATTTSAKVPVPVPPPPPEPPPVPDPPAPKAAYYANCDAARAAGAAPLHRGEPGYRAALDRDGDGTACEVTG